jgi:cyclophilin family peptidyl-prolyl cis-trans isomerase
MTFSARRRAAVALLTVAAVAVGCTGSPGATPSPTAGPTATPAPTTGSAACPTAQPAPLPAGETRTVTIETEKGTIVIKVEGALSPIAAGNFVALAGCGFYDGVGFHRIVAGFVIQGGDPDGTGGGGPGYTIQDEPVTATYKRGTLAMARTREPNSQGSQFFIVLDDSAADMGLAQANTYAIFGEVVEGMDVVDAIAAAADSELPSDPVVMTRVTVANP